MTPLKRNPYKKRLNPVIKQSTISNINEFKTEQLIKRAAKVIDGQNLHEEDIAKLLSDLKYTKPLIDRYEHHDDRANIENQSMSTSYSDDSRGSRSSRSSMNINESFQESFFSGLHQPPKEFSQLHTIITRPTIPKAHFSGNKSLLLSKRKMLLKPTRPPNISSTEGKIKSGRKEIHIKQNESIEPEEKEDNSEDKPSFFLTEIDASNSIKYSINPPSSKSSVCIRTTTKNISSPTKSPFGKKTKIITEETSKLLYENESLKHRFNTLKIQVVAFEKKLKEKEGLFRDLNEADELELQNEKQLSNEINNLQLKLDEVNRVNGVLVSDLDVLQHLYSRTKSDWSTNNTLLDVTLHKRCAKLQRKFDRCSSAEQHSNEILASLSSKQEQLSQQRSTLRHVYKEILNEQIQEMDDLQTIHQIRSTKDMMRHQIRIETAEDLNTEEEDELVETLVKAEVQGNLVQGSLNAKKEKITLLEKNLHKIQQISNVYNIDGVSNCWSHLKSDEIQLNDEIKDSKLELEMLLEDYDDHMKSRESIQEFGVDSHSYEKAVRAKEKQIEGFYADIGNLNTRIHRVANQLKQVYASSVLFGKYLQLPIPPTLLDMYRACQTTFTTSSDTPIDSSLNEIELNNHQRAMSVALLYANIDAKIKSILESLEMYRIGGGNGLNSSSSFSNRLKRSNTLRAISTKDLEKLSSKITISIRHQHKSNDDSNILSKFNHRGSTFTDPSNNNIHNNLDNGNSKLVQGRNRETLVKLHENMKQLLGSNIRIHLSDTLKRRNQKEEMELSLKTNRDWDSNLISSKVGAKSFLRRKSDLRDMDDDDHLLDGSSLKMDSKMLINKAKLKKNRFRRTGNKVRKRVHAIKSFKFAVDLLKRKKLFDRKKELDRRKKEAYERRQAAKRIAASRKSRRISQRKLADAGSSIRNSPFHRFKKQQLIRKASI